VLMLLMLNLFRFAPSVMTVYCKYVTKHILNLAFHILNIFILVSNRFLIPLLVSYCLTNIMNATRQCPMCVSDVG
jgi:hypothetical protein